MPGTAAPVVVSVSVLLLPAANTGLAENAPVTPAGAPSRASVTSPANPPVRDTPMAVVPLAPATMLTAAGVEVSETAGVAAAVSVRARLAVCVVTPVPDALIVTVLAPAVAVPATVRLSVLVVDPAAMVAGVNVAVTPLGSPVAASAMASVKPLERVIVIGTVAEPPTTILVAPLPAVSATAGTGIESA